MEITTPTEPRPTPAPPSPSRGEPWLSLLLYGAVFVALVRRYGDLDWGWHYRYGEHVARHGGILRRDVFSWTMDGYPWANHSWLYDLVCYLLYEHASFVGLSLAGALTATLAFWLAIRPVRLSFWQQGLLAVVFCVLVEDAVQQGLRTQVVGLLLLAALMSLLAGARAGAPWIHVALPALLVLWANLHGSFVLALGLGTLFVASEALLMLAAGAEEGGARRTVGLGLAMVVSAAAALLNPFGYRVYVEAVHHLNHPLLRWVAEWTPAPLDSLMMRGLVVYVLLLAAGVAWRRRREDLFLVLVAVVLLFPALRMRRYIGVYAVTTLPLAARILADVPLRLERWRPTRWVFAALAAVAVLGGIRALTPLRTLVAPTFEDYCAAGPRCSEGLTRRLLQQPPVGRGFNYYDWGGYFIGRGVQARLFIDGRMHLWERDGYAPYAAFMRIYWLDDRQLFGEYRFDWVIVPTGSALAKTLETSRGEPPIGRWDRVYADEVASYFVRAR